MVQDANKTQSKTQQALKEALILRDDALLELLYAAGLRVSEVSSLELARLDLNQGFVRVMGKGSKERLVPLHQKACQVLENYVLHARPVLKETPNLLMSFFRFMADHFPLILSERFLRKSFTRQDWTNLSARMLCVIPLLPIFCLAVRIYVVYKRCWATQVCLPLKFTLTLPRSI